MWSGRKEGRAEQARRRTVRTVRSEFVRHDYPLSLNHLLRFGLSFSDLRACPSFPVGSRQAGATAKPPPPPGRPACFTPSPSASSRQQRSTMSTRANGTCLDSTHAGSTLRSGRPRYPLPLCSLALPPRSSESSTSTMGVSLVSSYISLAGQLPFALGRFSSESTPAALKFMNYVALEKTELQNHS